MTMRPARFLLALFLLGGAAFGFTSGIHSLATGGSHCHNSAAWGHDKVEAPSAAPAP